MAINVPRSLVFIFLLLFLFFSPNYRTSSFSQQRELLDQVSLERHNLDVLKNSSYGGLDAVEGRWLNLSGLRKDDNYVWDWLPAVQERARTQSQIVSGTLPVVEGTLNDSDYSNGSLSVVNPLRSENGSLSFYQNSTGIIRGKWAQSRIGRAWKTDPSNFTNLAAGHTYASNDIKRNITGFGGDLWVQLGETSSDELASEPGLARGIKADMWIKDETSSGDGWQVVMFGVHYPEEGRMVLSTTSEKFAGIFALPHFALSKHSFSLARQLLNQTLNQVIGKQEESLDPVLNPWNSSPSTPSDALFPTARCEMIVYLQQHPIQGAGTILQEVEQELRFPTGTTLSSTPGMRFSSLIFSPDCGFVLESKGPPDYPPQEGTHLEGPKIEVYLTMVKRAVLCFAIGTSAQILLLKRQMQDASTPSTRSRISLYTVAMMATGDGFGFIGCWAVGIVIDSLFPPLIAAGFLSFLCVSFFGMRFIMDIWTVQAPERQAREREEQRRRDERNAAAAARNPGTLGSTPSPPTAPVITPAGADTLPFFVRRPPNSTSTQVILPPDQDLDAAAADNADPTDGAGAVPTTLSSARREAGALYTKFYFLFFGIIFLSLHASSWPVPLRTAYCNTLAFIYFSLWTPQIYRNVMRNCRKALRWEFVVGQSVLRLLPLTYFYLYTSNVVFVKTSPPAFYILAAWVWLQVWILISQEILGPRFFIREGWAPPAYDYHPLLRDNGGDEAGSLLPIGFSDSLRTTEPPPISPTSPFSPSSAGDGSSALPAALTRQSTGTGSRTITPGRRSKSTTNNKKDSSNKRIFDCAICTEDIEVPVIGSSGGERDGGGGGAGELSTSENVGEAAAMIFERRKYMVTPCRHIFHSGCLEGWMRYRLQCPICRENLPAL